MRIIHNEYMRKFFLLLLLLSSCSCEQEKISKVCPPPTSCIIQNDSIEIVDSALYPILGECQLGMTICNNNNEIAECRGFIGPVKETCDHKDNDCDGILDNGFDKDDDKFSICDNDCDDNNKTINPKAEEICDNIDNNCNGLINENLFIECWTGNSTASFANNSQCKKGIAICLQDGSYGTCMNQKYPEPEQCDGIDNDCNGQIDERIINSCGSSNIGACKYGDTICSENESLCVNVIIPTAEACDNIDNNCNGQIDENIFQPCSTICERGVKQCNAGQWGNCNARLPSQENCDDIDNDCDGEIDETCEFSHGDIQRCYF